MKWGEDSRKLFFVCCRELLGAFFEDLFRCCVDLLENECDLMLQLRFLLLAQFIELLLVASLQLFLLLRSLSPGILQQFL